MHHSPTRPGARPGQAGLRVTGRRAQTAVWTLRHPQTGRTVSLVGTMHIGDRRYFDELTAVVAALAAGGAEVHVEGIAHRDGDQLTGWERDRLAEARRWNDPESSGAAVTALQLDSQRALQLPPAARNIDLSHAELLRRVGWPAYRRLFAPSPADRSPVGFPPLVRAAVRFQLRHQRGLEWARALNGRDRRVNRVVIDERNAVAFAGAVDTLERSDVVLVWGADHLPGLRRCFERAGYRLLGERWVTACRL